MFTTTAGVVFISAACFNVFALSTAEATSESLTGAPFL